MQYIRKIVLFFICLSVFASAIANASASCCLNIDNVGHTQQSEQPCHNNSTSQDQSAQECDNCQHCTHISFLAPHIGIIFSDIISENDTYYQSLRSLPIELQLQPPKNLS